MNLSIFALIAVAILSGGMGFAIGLTMGICAWSNFMSEESKKEDEIF